MPDHEDPDRLSRKRRRVQAACDECRSKKIKCDGRQPVCSPCSQRHGLSAFCEWGARKGRGPGVTKDDFQRLQQRIRELESGQSSVVPQHPASVEAVTPSTANHQSFDEVENDHGNNAMMGLLEAEQRSTPNERENSSAKSFTNQLKRVLNRHSMFRNVQEGSSSKSSPAKLHRKHPRLDDYILPPRNRADHLLNCYWDLADTLYPFLDKKMFLSMYRQLWTGGDLDDEFPTFLCTLNIVFALACNLDGAIEPARRAHEAEVFYQRAEEFLELDLLRKRSISSVRCFLLLAQYLQSTHDSQQCWIFVGLAIRIAQSLGFDLPQAAESSPGEDAGMIRRVWHGCVLMDRTLSMTYGRSPMIMPQAATAVPLPTASMTENNSNYSGDVGLWAPEVSNDFFVETLKLYETMAELLTAWYNTPLHSWGLHGDLLASDSGGLGAKAIGRVLEIDRTIWVWRRSLPVHLKWDVSDPTRSKIHQRQSNVLRMRHHHIRILLFRPLLAKFCARETIPPSDERILPWKIVLQCCITCVETAVDTISALHEGISVTPLGQVDELLPAWWYTIFYAYSAATILVAARLHPDITTAISESTIMNSWQKVLDTFDFFSAFSKHATTCAVALRALFEQASEHRSSSHQNQSHQDVQPQDILPRTPQPGWRIHRTRDPESFSIPVENVALGPSLVQQRNGMAMDHPSYQDVVNFSSALDLLDLPDIQIDLDQMSWLTSFPAALQ